MSNKNEESSKFTAAFDLLMTDAKSIESLIADIETAYSPVINRVPTGSECEEKAEDPGSEFDARVLDLHNKLKDIERKLTGIVENCAIS